MGPGESVLEGSDRPPHQLDIAVTHPGYNGQMRSEFDTRRPSRTDHEQAVARLGDREVAVDVPLVPLLEALHDGGFTTIFSCQDTQPSHGRWRDDPDKPRFYVSVPDVDELRRLLPILEQSETLARSIRPCFGSPRWEYLLSLHGGGFDSGPLRLQVSVFVPVEQLELVVQTLRSATLTA